ncbi:hypothetical protein HPB52_008491 [Rhipicephalus sanguineus]|uniref:Geranylgeranyl pyrophosphate synthase/polyprenyl synthetase n=1 Tax=Rhipicephalus sanguineus TaxID=34632 RepID=A0A9D4PMS4_RHISA|nr:hypothetical protein HPB52_008491 [Rhipicephalus sanguineus]
MYPYRRLIYNGRTNIQTRGLIVLLLSKAAGHPSTRQDCLEEERVAGITQRQRSLAEITEMIHTAHLIHRGVLNLSNDLFPDATTLKDLQFGNKISVLTGDYLIANASKSLTDLKNCKVVDLVATAIGDFMQSEFLGDHDLQGSPIPSPGMGIAQWEEKNYLSTGSLMSNSCQATLELASHEQDFQELGFEFGKSIGLAWQVHSDLQPFVDTYRHPPGMPFVLTSAPVVLHLESDPSLLEEIRSHRDNVEKLDYLKAYLDDRVLLDQHWTGFSPTVDGYRREDFKASMKDRRHASARQIDNEPDKRSAGRDLLRAETKPLMVPGPYQWRMITYNRRIKE